MSINEAKFISVVTAIKQHNLSFNIAGHDSAKFARYATAALRAALECVALRPPY